MFEATHNSGDLDIGLADEASTAIQLGLVPLRLLRHRDGSVLAPLPLVLVSPRMQRRFRSGFGLQASGPLAALFVPPGFRLEPDEQGDDDGVFALSLTREGMPAPRGRLDLLTSRLPIDATVFAALHGIDAQRARIVDPRREPQARVLLHWMARAASLRLSRSRSGHDSSRRALREWSDRITGIEDVLLGRCDTRAATAIAETLSDRAALRRFSRVTGYGPLRYRREVARRVLGAAPSVASVQAG